MLFLKDENGATAIEYGIISGFSFALIVSAYSVTYTKISTALSIINTAILIS